MWLCVYFCGILSIVSFLIPKQKEEEKRSVSLITNYNRLNDNLRECLQTAMRIDEQKRLDYIKSKPTLQSGGTLGIKRMETGGSGSSDQWNPLLKREATTTVNTRHSKSEFFLIQPDAPL